MRKLALAIFLGSFVSVVSSLVLAVELAAYQWRHRLLVLVAPRVGDPAAVQQRTAIESFHAELSDRDMVVFELYLDGDSRVGHQPLTVAQAKRLRRELNVEPNTSVMILIGKDGGIKRRASLATDLREVFKQIDRMPMRRAEIRAKIDAGEPITRP